MSIWHALLLGLIQGITEFLPVSSSGHLLLGQYFLGFHHSQDIVLFDLVCHLGTLFAIVFVLFPLIKEFTASNQRWNQIILGTLPLFPLVFIIKPLKTLFSQPHFLGPCFLCSSALLFAGLHFRFSFLEKRTHRHWLDPLTIGCFQALAILPGVSRSGATISAASLLGWNKNEAITFSFLLAIPAILGGIAIESWQAWNHPASLTIDILPFLVGFLTSFVVGTFSLRLLIRAMVENKWNYFGWYCLLLGLFLTVYFNRFL
jgi:undecaprenyl-diphosphatase